MYQWLLFEMSKNSLEDKPEVPLKGMGSLGMPGLLEAPSGLSGSCKKLGPRALPDPSTGTLPVSLDSHSCLSCLFLLGLAAPPQTPFTGCPPSRRDALHTWAWSKTAQHIPWVITVTFSTQPCAGSSEGAGQAHDPSCKGPLELTQPVRARREGLGVLPSWGHVR